MSIPRAHHFVPRFYLGGFTDPTATKPFLWVYEKNKPIRRSRPEAEAHWRDFYAFEDKGHKNFKIEEILSSIEGLIAPLVKEGDPEAILAATPTVSVFVALTQWRVPAERDCTC